MSDRGFRERIRSLKADFVVDPRAWASAINRESPSPDSVAVEIKGMKTELVDDILKLLSPQRAS